MEETPAAALPMHTFTDQTAAMAEHVLAYTLDRLRLDPVPLDHSRDVARLEREVPDMIREEGHDADHVLALFAEHIAPSVLSADSPRFLSFIPAAPTKASLLFDSVVSASSLNGISWLEASGAIHAENQVLGWLARVAGLPAGAGGCFVSGGSAGNLSALAVARDVGRHRRGDDRVRMAISAEAHTSVGRTLHLLGVEPVLVPTDDGRLTGEALRAVVEADTHPEDIVAAVATAGTTNAGIVDDLDGVGSFAGGRGMWFHVDGAYGLAGVLDPDTRHRFDGIERADSFIVDPHKWLFAPFDCAALVYRQPSLARAVHTQDASYLDAIHEDPAEWNPTDYAYHLTRRARGLALWFSLAVYGVAAYRDAIASSIRLARTVADLINTTPGLELVREPELGIVLFRVTGWTPEHYRRWWTDLLEAQVALALPTIWRGETVGRFVFLHPGTTLGMVEEILATIPGVSADRPAADGPL